MTVFTNFLRASALSEPLNHIETYKTRVDDISRQTLAAVDMRLISISMLEIIVKRSSWTDNGALFQNIIEELTPLVQGMYNHVSVEEIEKVLSWVLKGLTNNQEGYKKFTSTYYDFQEKKTKEFSFSLVQRRTYANDDNVYYKITREGATLYYYALNADIITQEKLNELIITSMIGENNFREAISFAEKTNISSLFTQDRIREAYEMLLVDADQSINDVLAAFDEGLKILNTKTTLHRKIQIDLQDKIGSIQDTEKADAAQKLKETLNESDNRRRDLIHSVITHQGKVLALKSKTFERRRKDIQSIDPVSNILIPALSSSVGFMSKLYPQTFSTTFRISPTEVFSLPAYFDFLMQDMSKSNKKIEEKKYILDDFDVLNKSNDIDEDKSSLLAHKIIEKIARDLETLPHIQFSEYLSSIIHTYSFSDEEIRSLHHNLYTLLIDDSRIDIAHKVGNFSTEYILRGDDIILFSIKNKGTQN